MKKKIVIVGGGFAGLELIRKLADHHLFDVVLVDRNNYHFFPPLLYQVSTAFIEPSNIAYPFRKLFQGRQNIRFFMGELISVSPDTHTILTSNGLLNYDYLVLAMGAESNFFDNDNIAGSALPMKTIDDALNIRNHILLQIEEAVRTWCLKDKKRLSNVVIAGGGPTGVEMAGMLAEMAQHISTKDYPEDGFIPGEIYLINRPSSLLAPMSQRAQREAYETLDKLGVKIVLNTEVNDYINDEVVLSNGERIPSSTLIWTSGVIAREVDGLPAAAIARGRRIIVDEINKIKGCSNIFAIGDQCFQTTDRNYPNGHPQLAQVAIQQGRLLGDNLKRLAANKPVRAFSYRDKGSMAIISKYRAVADLPRIFLKGLFAWLIWLFVHILPLIGFRNKIKIAFNWFWSFVTNNPALRLIIRPVHKPNGRQ